MDIKQESLAMHEQLRGKIEVISRCPVNNTHDLTLAYTPGVAEPCLKIAENKELSYLYTRRWNSVAVISDGTAVLGLGDIGPEAAMPVMEGKCVLFKSFANIDAYPLVLASKNVDEIVQTIRLLAPSFGGINLEDISAPRCFEIEQRLKEVCDIPVFHDDQHGTAIVMMAGLLNALKVVGKRLDEISVVTSGAGAAGTAVVRLLRAMGLKDVVVCDRKGAIYAQRGDLNPQKADLAQLCNSQKRGSLPEVIEGADVFIGVSSPGLLNRDMVKRMAKDAIIFACANPTPEIFPDEAKAGGAAVIATGRSDFPNQVNNVMAFPGIFRGALDVRASKVNEEMKVAAAYALADLVDTNALCAEHILPFAFDSLIVPAVSQAVARAARESGVAKL